MSSASKHEQFHEIEITEWDFVPADPAVGFSGGYYHEDCPVEDGPRPAYGIVSDNNARDGRTVTCNACGGFTDIPASEA